MQFVSDFIFKYNFAPVSYSLKETIILIILLSEFSYLLHILFLDSNSLIISSSFSEVERKHVTFSCPLFEFLIVKAKAKLLSDEKL